MAAKTSRIKVKQVRSGIGFDRKQKETLRSLGLKKLNQTVELPDNPAVRGMVSSVGHLVEIVRGGGGTSDG
jgi:large subunit ribosomal protein L30